MADETFELDLELDDSDIINAQQRLDIYERSVRRVSQLSRSMEMTRGVPGGAGVASSGVSAQERAQSAAMTHLGSQIGAMLGGRGMLASAGSGQVSAPTTIPPWRGTPDDTVRYPDKRRGLSPIVTMNQQQASQQRRHRSQRRFDGSTTGAAIGAGGGFSPGRQFRSEGMQSARGGARQAAMQMGRGRSLNVGRNIAGMLRGTVTGMFRGAARGIFAGPKGIIAGAVIGGVIGGVSDRIIDRATADTPSERSIEAMATRDRFIRREIMRGERDPREITGGLRDTGFTWRGDREMDGFSGPGWRFNMVERMQEAARQEHDRRIRGMQTELPDTEMEIQRIEETIERLLRI